MLILEQQQRVDSAAQPFQTAAVADDHDIYGAAMEIAASAYRGFKDKGNTVKSSLWDHIQRVERRVTTRFNGHVPESELFVYRAAAVLHELPELKAETADGGRARVFTPLQWRELLRQHHMPDYFIGTVDALAVREGEPYLDYVRRVGSNPIARTIKLHGDLPENSSSSRVKLPHKETTQQFRDKKTYLYEMASLYLQARESHEIGDISVAEFIMSSRFVPGGLKNRDILARYSSEGTYIPTPQLAFPGIRVVRGAYTAVANTFSFFPRKPAFAGLVMK